MFPRIMALGYLWQFMEINGNLWKFMAIYEN